MFASQEQMADIKKKAEETTPITKEPFKEVVKKTKTILSPFKDCEVLKNEKILPSPMAKKRTKKINKKRNSGELVMDQPVINFIGNMTINQIAAASE